MAREIDWQLFEKAVDVTASALRGAMGSERSQPPQYAADVFRAVWEAMKDAAGDPVSLGDREVTEVPVEHQAESFVHRRRGLHGPRLRGHPLGHGMPRRV